MTSATGRSPPTAGEARVDGHRYAELPNPAAVLGTLLDAGAVHPGRTGRAHLRILADTIGVPARRVDEVLDQVDLAAAGRRRIGAYSLGMRQRLGIAGALLADPPVLMFDEPANGLDPEGIRWMRGLLRGHAARGGPCCVSSHLLGEVEHTVDPGGDRRRPGGRGRSDRRAARRRRRARPDPRPGRAGRRAARRRLRGHRRRRPGRAPGDRGAPEQVGLVAARGGHVLTGLRPADRPLEELFFQLTAA